MPAFRSACWFLVACALAGDVAARAQEQAPNGYAETIAPVLAKYCNGCHGGARPKGWLALDVIKTDADAEKNVKLWLKIVENLRSGEMPPAGKPRPTAAENDRVVHWIEKEMLRVDCTKGRDPGIVSLRRLNKAEYRNTIRDLLGVDYEPTDEFPADDVGYGFDNIGDVLTVSPLLMEKYLAAAEKIAELAFKNPASRAKLVPRLPGSGEEHKAAVEMLQPILQRAYRRQVLGDEVERFTRFVALAQKNGDGFERGMQLAVQALLTAPNFLFHIERSPRAKGSVTTFQITEFELASRLSYFLWSSMPDDELLSLAEKRELREGDVLERQVRRLLRDPRAQALTDNFAGQWLQLRSVKSATPDRKTFPAFDEALRQAMIRETELFFAAVVREDRSVLDFLDADFTYVNERLAKHYGLKGVKGPEFRRVSLTGTPRRGVLTQASILTVTSNPTRTSPVKRGKWILENILNTPPPPPPPDVPELDDDGKELTGSLRQRMEQHRAKPLCASCHQRMDALGFGFENFDGIGAWRERDGKFAVDASGLLPGGESFKGPLELVKVLKARQGEFRRCLAEKMLTYALGRGLELYDKCTLDDLCSEMQRHQDRFSSLVLAIVKSDAFQMRRGRK
jgi:mono/diheme cytochrome c family protein